MSGKLLPIVIGGVIAIAVVIGVLVGTSTGPTLDQLLADRDCKGLTQWEQDHIYDEDLVITPEQRKEMIKMAFECSSKAIDNVFGGNSEVVKDDSEKSLYKENIAIVTELIQNRNCDGVVDLVNEGGYAYGSEFGFSGEEMGDIVSYVTYCENFAAVDRDGFDVSETWDKYPIWDAKE